MNERVAKMLEMPRPAARRLPHSDDAEKGLIGSLLQRPGLIDDTSDLPLEAIYDPARQRILEVMREMCARLQAVDMITLTDRLEGLGILANMGGAAAVAAIYEFVPSAGNWKHYADIVREKWIRRCILDAAAKQQELAYQDADSVEELIAQCEENVLHLRAQTIPENQEGVVHCKAAVYRARDQIEAVFRKRGQPIGMSSGIPDWDRSTGGFHNGDMIVIGGRPSQGKSALAMQIAEHVAIDCKRPVAFFSVEMDCESLMKRTLLSRSRIDEQRLRDGFFDKPELAQIDQMMLTVVDSPLYLDRCASLTAANFRSKARRAKMRWKIELIVIDYLQLMRSTSKRAQENRQTEVAEISRTIKEVACELNIPVVVCAQLSRDVEQVARRPRLSDLKESGSIEQDADQVMLIYHLTKKEREELEKKRNELLADDDADLDKVEKLRYDAQLLLRKQRKGPVTDVNVRWKKEFTYFEPVTQKLYSNKPEERQG